MVVCCIVFVSVGTNLQSWAELYVGAIVSRQDTRVVSSANTH